MGTHLFVYGTLLFPEMVFAVTGKQFCTLPAVLEGRQRHKVYEEGQELLYPALQRTEGQKVDGKLLFDVDADSLHKIGEFEGDTYHLQVVTVLAEDIQYHAFVYAWKESGKQQLT